MRIAVGGFHIESSAFTPYRSGAADFRVLEGQALLESHTFIAGQNASTEAKREQDGPVAIEVIDEVEWVPLVHMRALPGGPIDADFYRDFHTRFMNALRKASLGGLDGVLLDIHGAALVEGIEDAEGVFASQVREIVGDTALIGATMDLHGNVSDRLFGACDLLTCYRTAPHIDAAETRYRAAKTLVESLNTGRPVYRAKINVPILLPGEKTSTVVEPGKSLYQKINEVETNPEIIDAAIWMGFPWGDEDRCRGAVVASATTESAAREAAIELATEFWRDHDDFVFVGPTASAEESVQRALECASGPFFISDTGDNTGAGGIGDLVIVLTELYEQHQRTRSEKSALVSAIYDPETARMAFTQPGSTLEVCIGGKVAPNFGPSFKGRATVRHTFVCPQGGKSAVLDLAVSSGTISVVVTEQRTQYGREEMFHNAGLQSFEDYDIFVVKMGYLEPDLAAAAYSWTMAITPGAVDQDLTRLNYSSPACHEVYPMRSEPIIFSPADEITVLTSTRDAAEHHHGRLMS